MDSPDAHASRNIHNQATILKEGQLVLLENKEIIQGTSNKLLPLRKGIWKVINKVTDVTYDLEDTGTKKIARKHRNLMLPYFPKIQSIPHLIRKFQIENEKEPIQNSNEDFEEDFFNFNPMTESEKQNNDRIITTPSPPPTQQQEQPPVQQQQPPQPKTQIQQERQIRRPGLRPKDTSKSDESSGYGTKTFIDSSDINPDTPMTTREKQQAQNLNQYRSQDRQSTSREQILDDTFEQEVQTPIRIGTKARQIKPTQINQPKTPYMRSPDSSSGGIISPDITGTSTPYIQPQTQQRQPYPPSSSQQQMLLPSDFFQQETPTRQQYHTRQQYQPKQAPQQRQETPQTQYPTTQKNIETRIQAKKREKTTKLLKELGTTENQWEAMNKLGKTRNQPTNNYIYYREYEYNDPNYNDHIQHYNNNYWNHNRW
jgi:hypothetical protein